MQNNLIEQLMDIGEPSGQRRFAGSQTALMDPTAVPKFLNPSISTCQATEVSTFVATRAM